MQAGLFALYIFFVVNKVRGRAEPFAVTRHLVRTNIHAFPAYLIPIVVLGTTLVSAWIIKSGVPQSFAAQIVESDLKPWQFLLIMNACLLILGMFLEGVAIALIVLPVVFVVVRQLRIDMTYFAVVMVINIELALLSPPIGLNLFVMSNVTGRPVSEVLRGTIPFFLIMLCLLMLVTFVPARSTWLPNLVLGS